MDGEDGTVCEWVKEVNGTRVNGKRGMNISNMTINRKTWDFIQRHRDEDVRKLALRGCKDPDVDFPFALQQIQGRQKAKDKLPDFYANENMLYPPTISMEQCSSSQAAKYKASIVSGESFADLSGGFGVDALALAKVFEQGYYVEPMNELCELVRHNANIFNINNLQILNGTMEEMLPTLSELDVIYLDPSRRNAHGQRVVTLQECTPDLTQHKEQLLEKARKLVLVKLSPMLDLKATLALLPETTAIHVVAVNGECREILLLLSHSIPEKIDYHAVNIQNGHISDFQFSNIEEMEAVPALADSLGAYLLEPNAAVMKAGGFKCIATRYGLQKLHPHTHLYTCDTPSEDFPGRQFRIVNHFHFNKKEAAKHLSGIKKANIAVRNFPWSAEELRKQLKLADGGGLYLFGATMREGEHTIIVGEKL